MQAVVLAAGEGTRMRPLTDERPKGLVEVAGKPLLAHALDALVALGVDEVVVVVGYRGDQVVERFGDAHRGTPLSYVRQDERLGLAHALRQAAPELAGDFLLVNGDNVFGPDADLARVVERHRETDASATLLTESVAPETARTTGVCAFEDDGSLAGLVEKPDDPPSTRALTGFFAFSPAVLHAAELVTPSDRGEYELTDAIDLLLAAGHRVETVPLSGWRLNVNTPADRERASERLDGET